jgi:hypothetical protein
MKNTSSKNRTRDVDFNHTPPMFADLCSVQAADANPAGPILTIYHEQPSTAADWIAEAARDKRFEAYLRRGGKGYWERWDVNGEPTDGGNYLPFIPFQESTTPVPVDRAAFLQEAREFTGDAGLSLIACREGHAGASAADHSNFDVVCRLMIADADPADLDHVVIIDSRKWPCPVTGVFANVARLSPTMQDVFLDRVPCIQNSWPLDVGAFHTRLMYRLVNFRQSYVFGLLRDCGHVARMSEDRITAMMAKWKLASGMSRYKIAIHIVETLGEGLVYEKQTAETFSEEIIQGRGADVMKIVKDYTKHITYR